MLEQIRQQLKQLEQQLEVNQEIEQADKEVLAQLSQDLHAHIDRHEPQKMHGRVQDAYEKFSVTHPDLAVILGSLMQILQNIGI